MPRRKTGKLIATVPGAANFRAIAERFLSDGGIVTSFSEPLVRLAAGWTGEDDPEREALPFRTVVRTFARLSNVEPGSIANARLEREAVAQACADLDVDSPFYRGRAHPGTHRLLAEAISELDHALYPWEAPLPDSLPEELAARMRSLIAIRSAAEAYLSAVGLKRFATFARELVDEIPPEPLAQPIRLLLFAMAPYNLLYGKLIEWLSAQAEVWVVVERSAAGQDLFHDASAFARHLPLSAEEAGTPLGLARHAFAADPVVDPVVEVQVWRYPDDLYEAEWTLRLAAERIASGIPPHRVCIFTREPERTFALLEAASRRLGVPVTLERKVPLLSNALIRLLLRLLESLAANDPRPLGAFARTSYLREPVDLQRSLAALGREAYASGLGWQHESFPDLPWLSRLREWQRENGAAERSPIEWSSKLIDLAAILQDKEDAFGEGPTEERDRRALERAQQEIRAWLSIRPEAREPISLAGFLRVCQSLWKEAETFPPSSASGVRVAGQAVAVGEVDVLFALGVVEGRFPRGSRENGVLGDEDRAALGRAFGIRLETSTEVAARERDEFYRVASSSNRIVFSYPAFSSDDREQSPGYYLRQVPSPTRTRQRSEVVPTDQPARHPADAALAAALKQRASRPSPVVFLDVERVRAALPKPSAREVSQLRVVAECGFHSFARHSLDLKPERESTRWHWVTRLPERAGLVFCATREEAREKLERALAEMLDELRFHVSDWELRMLEAGGEAAIGQWVEREFNAREAWPRSVRSAPYIVELGPVSARCEALLIAEQSKRPILRITRQAPWDERSMSEWQRLEVATRLMHVQRHLGSELPPVLEVETMGAFRQLVCAFRPADWRFPSELRPLELYGYAQDEAAAWSELRRTASAQLKAVMEKARSLQIAPEPGDHCRYCEYGELCRRSREYSEEVSPFDDGPEP